MLSDLIRGLVARITKSKSARRQAGGGAKPLERAHAFYEAGEMAAAQDAYEQVLRGDEGNLEAKYYLGVILGRAGRYPEAHALLQQVAVAQHALAADALNALGNIARVQGQPEDAEAYYRRVLAMDAGAASVWVNLALCLRDTGRYDDATAALQQALQLDPHHADAMVKSAMVCNDLGKAAEAQALLHRILERAPNLAEAHVELAQILLLRGEFAAGWDEYEWRLWREKWQPQLNYPCPVWKGEDLGGKTLLVTAEQGLGDQIMFASCLPELLRIAGSAIIECHPRLAALFGRSFPDAVIFPHRYRARIAKPNAMAVPDVRIACGSLPGLMRRARSDFPRHTGYLRASPMRVAHWRARLDALGDGRKIGISWRGGTPRTRRNTRSTELLDWLPLLRRAGCHFVSLQYGACDEEIRAVQHSSGVLVHEWREAIDDYDETAALVAALDLVISVQTAVVHLAGALGKQAWVLVPAVAEWRYLESGETMPWYPSVRLFRQRDARYWQPVLAGVAAELAGLARN